MSTEEALTTARKETDEQNKKINVIYVAMIIISIIILAVSVGVTVACACN